MTHKSLCAWTIGNSVLFIVYVSVPWWPICIIIHLEVFIDNCQVWDHSDNLSRSFCSSKLSPLLCVALHILTSA
ncbi:unnamed protein product [Schistosoma rodhaini]|nr:unnamed protein product [Schistosoma rodhaini]